MRRAKALYDCMADNAGELSFKVGTILVDVTPSSEENWFEGRVEGTERRGLIPFNYIDFLPDLPCPIPMATASRMRRVSSSSMSPSNSITMSTWSLVADPLRSKASINNSQPTSRPNRASPGDHDDDVEDDDGFQLVKPSQISRQQRRPSVKPAHSSTTVIPLRQERETVQPPPLPSRPVAAAASTTTAVPPTNSLRRPLDASSSSAHPLLPPPPTPPTSLKPATSGGKARSVSQPLPAPPPLPNKPILDVRHYQLQQLQHQQQQQQQQQQQETKTNPATTAAAPMASTPPLFTALDAQNTLIKPSALRARARAMTSPTAGLRPFFVTTLAERSSTDAQSSPPPPLSRKPMPPPSGPHSPTSPSSLPPPPPPPPARARALTRYDVLFDAIQDQGYVDGKTVRMVWRRSRLSEHALAQVWQQCDPQQRGVLDRRAFIDGTRRIDDLLRQNDEKPRSAAA